MRSEQATLPIDPDRCIGYSKKDVQVCVSVIISTYIIDSLSCASRTDPLCPSLFTEPVLYGYIRQQPDHWSVSALHSLHSSQARKTSETPSRTWQWRHFKEGKIPYLYCKRKLERNRLRSWLKVSIMNDRADRAAALALQVSECVVTTERPTFPNRIWQASVQEQITSLSRTNFIKGTLGGAVRSSRHSGYSFSNVLTLLAWLLPKASPPWEQNFVKRQWPYGFLFKATFTLLDKCLQKSQFDRKG